jgi:uroporphyrinogen-III synthase
MAARTLLVTRPRAQGEAFAAVLEVLLPGRFRVVLGPLLTIVPLPGAVELAGVAGLVFTSANGVEAFAARSGERGLPAFCVGKMTAAAARAAGFRARSADGDVDDLARLIEEEWRGGTLLHVRGRHAAGDLAGRLAAAGVELRAAEIYDQVRAPLPAGVREGLLRGTIDAVAFFSPRTARLFAAAAAGEGWALAGAAAVSLSAAADAGLDGVGFGRRLVAPAPTREGMLAALAAL